MNVVKRIVKFSMAPSEACKGTLQHRVLPAFVEKLSEMGKKAVYLYLCLNKFIDRLALRNFCFPLSSQTYDRFSF